MMRPLRILWDPEKFLLAGALALAVSFTMGFLWKAIKPGNPVLKLYDYPEEVQWMTCEDSEQYTVCFRKDFHINKRIRNAYAVISAGGGYELIINGNTCSRYFLWRATRPFQNGLSAAGQRIQAEDPVMALNFPREHQWTLHRNSAIPTWVDITSYITQGHNNFSIEVEGRIPQPGCRFFAVIEYFSGEKETINLDRSWKAEPVPYGLSQFEWTFNDKSVGHWRQAVRCPHPPYGPVYRHVPKESFSHAFQGQWISTPSEITGHFIRFGKDFILDNKPDEAFLRMLTSWKYQVWINGEKMEVVTRDRDQLHRGDWVIRETGRAHISVDPELLDPDEAAGIFVGTRFQTPNHGDPTENDFKRYRNEMNRTKDRASEATQAGMPGDYLDNNEKGSIWDLNANMERQTLKSPHTLSRDRGENGFHIFEIAPLLKNGRNTIEISIILPIEFAYNLSWRPRFACDLGFVSHDNSVSFESSNGTWKYLSDGQWDDVLPVNYSAAGSSILLPEKKFLGFVSTPSTWYKVIVISGALVFLWAYFFVSHNLYLRLNGMRVYIIAYGLMMFMWLLLKLAFRERSEILIFHYPPFWIGFIILSMLFVIIVSLFRAIRWKRSYESSFRSDTLILIVLCFITFFLRAWMVDWQPLDDDEYASVQASLGIAEKGAPEFVEGIWYTRSPLYHYVAGGVAWLFGEDIFVLRYFSIFSGVLTLYYIYLIGIEFFGKRKITLVACFIYSIHPFLVYTSHIARFYQQQQLFTIITVYYFFKAFTEPNPGMRLRYIAVLSFISAILSQEISLLIVFPLTLCYALFSLSRPIGDEIKLTLFGGVTFSYVVLDILLFKLKCMTRLEGISPNVEATIKPHMWDILNVFSIFIGYSRIHIVMGFFYVFGFLAALKRGQTRILGQHMFLLLGILFTNLFVSSVSYRYQYSLIPLFILAAVHGLEVFSRKLSDFARLKDCDTTPVFGAVGLIFIVLSFSPWRMPPSYTEKIVGDSTGAFQFISHNKREGDKVGGTEPHPHAALLETGSSDYDIAVPTLYDFVFLRDGYLIDRNGGALAVGRLGQLQEEFSKHDRIWIALNREKFRNRGKNIRWEYPGARIELFLRQNTQLVYRGYLWHVYLWDKNQAKWNQFRQEPNQIVF